MMGQPEEIPVVERMSLSTPIVVPERTPPDPLYVVAVAHPRWGISWIRPDMQLTVVIKKAVTFRTKELAEKVGQTYLAGQMCEHPTVAVHARTWVETYAPPAPQAPGAT